MLLPPLSLYIHIPWCEQKCPYCDFNSHKVKETIPEDAYIQHLLNDLENDLIYVQDRPLQSIFIGGGTPSLFSAESIEFLLTEVQKRIAFAPDIEITLEANPGSVEAQRFIGYKQAGVNRISMGIQSFDDDKLQRIGRIHNSKDAIRAVELAKQNQLASFNLDLMHGLPNQTVHQALSDLQQAVELQPPHLSWYQLTIEPNTLFASRTPKLPNDDILWNIFSLGHNLLVKGGYQQYETSAYSKPGYQCKHNLNYWRFGDYLAIGCGAHGKISFTNNDIIRFSKTKHPKGYLTGSYTDSQHNVSISDRPFEYFMNRFRLLEAVPKEQFSQFTGLDIKSIEQTMNLAIDKQYITITNDYWQITEHGKLFLNQLLELFLAD